MPTYTIGKKVKDGFQILKDGKDVGYYTVDTSKEAKKVIDTMNKKKKTTKKK